MEEQQNQEQQNAEEPQPSPEPKDSAQAQGAQQVASLATGGGATSVALKSPLFSWLQKPFPVLHWILSTIPIAILIPLAAFIPLLWALACLILGLPFTQKIKIPLFPSLVPRPTPFEFVASLTLFGMIILALFLIAMATLCFTVGGQLIKGALNFLYDAGISCGT